MSGIGRLYPSVQHYASHRVQLSNGHVCLSVASKLPKYPLTFIIRHISAQLCAQTCSYLFVYTAMMALRTYGNK